MTISPKVSIGPTSILGWIGALAGIVVTAVLSLSEHAALLSGPGKWSAILATVALVGTGLGRQFQAAHLPKEIAVSDDAVKVAELLGPLVASNIAAATANPDGVDSAAVPFSGVQAATPPAT